MTAEIVELGIKVSNKDLDETGDKFDKAAKQARNAQGQFTSFGNEGEKAAKKVNGATEKMNEKMNDAVKVVERLFAAYIGFEGMKSFIEKTIEVNRNLASLRGTLVSVVGDAVKAREALDLLSEWADKTPFSINEAVDAFTALRLRGIAPTEQRLTAFGNIAAAQRRSLTDFTDAVGQATNGMYRGLAQFGIKIDESKGRLKATFDGTTTIMKDNGRDLVNYLVKIGETRFATGMVDQMHEIGGEIKHLGDATEAFYRKVGDAGLTNALSRLIRVFADAVEASGDFATMLGKGLAAAINATLDAIDWLNKNIAGFSDIIKSLALLALINMFLALLKTVGLLTTAFKLLSIAMNMSGIGFLVAATTLVIARMGGLQKTLLAVQAGFVILGSAFAKFGVSFVNVANAIWEGFKGAFGNIKDILVAFKDDIIAFVTDPLGSGQAFDKFSAALAKGVTSGFREAYDKARKDGEQLTADIDKDANEQLAAIGAKMAALDAAAKKSDALKLKTGGLGGLSGFAGSDTTTGGNTAQAAKYSEIVGKYLDQLRQENKLVTMTAREQEKMKALYTLENQLKAEGLSLTEQDRQKVLELADAHYQLVKQQEAWNELSDNFKTGMASSLKEMFKNGKKGMKDMLGSWEDMFYDFIAKRMSEDFFSPIFDALTAGLRQSFSSSGTGGFLSGIFGGLFGGGGSSSYYPNSNTWIDWSTPGAADGGEFAPISGAIDNRMAKLRVNKDETVLVRRRGDTSSGGANVTVNVYNSANNTTTRQEERQDMFGGKTIDVFIDEVTAKNMRSSGSQTRQAMRGEFGASQRLAPR